MGKWAMRLAEKTAPPPSTTTDKTDKTPLLSVLSVPREGGARDFQAPPTRAVELEELGAVLDMSAAAWTDVDISTFQTKRAQLLFWGWAELEAQELAERIVKRNRDHDGRVSCTDCAHYKPGRCGNHRRASLNVAEVGRDLAATLQWCPGFEPAR